MSATVVEAPQEYDGPGPSVFLAGGISGTTDWQQQVVGRLSDVPVTLLNPRRANYPWHDPSAAAAQIEWEFRHLHRATAILFWFPPETLCPIALFELGGRVQVREQALFVGTDPAYARKLDVEIQLRLARPEVQVTTSVWDLAEQVRGWLAARQSA
ncbi:nucleoside 2-deoxyribosyltransferase domain-containing protein [Gemmata sp.]|uniref:nucleoside 2-deoxyribosyltransferase domain-containing protein n=1 Tax=Gemmata sp. TaxID=1914242 RepID=UPI003F6E4B91